MSFILFYSIVVVMKRSSMATSLQVTTDNNLTNHVVAKCHRLPDPYPSISWKTLDFHCLQLYAGWTTVWHSLKLNGETQFTPLIISAWCIKVPCYKKNRNKYWFKQKSLLLEGCWGTHVFFNGLSSSPFSACTALAFTTSLPVTLQCLPWEKVEIFALHCSWACFGQ